MKKDCSYFATLITGLIDNELNSSDKREVELHLDNCPECKEQYIDEIKIKDVIKEKIPVQKAPSYLQNRIRRQLIRNGDKPGLWHLVHSIFIYQPIPATFALAVIIGLVFLPVSRILDNSPSVALDNQSYSEPINERVELKGEIICLDCDYLSQSLANVQHDPLLHRSGIKTEDGNIWTFVNSKDFSKVAHNKKISKKALVTGILFQKAHYIYVNEYKTL